ncbi:MAG: DNA polymerase I [Micrococcales bacterium]
MNAKPTLLLIDGHSLMFRAFYALSPDSFRTPDGQHTNAVHGFISMMLNILGLEKPTHLAVAFDISRESFRTLEYPEYKGTRGETPPEFIGQTELLREALDAMNILNITRENYEADDIIASLADQAADAGFEVFVVSGDRDTFQLIRDETTILYPVKGVLNLARMNDEAVYEKYGVHAKQYPDLAALVGETSDNLPGIPGVGPKTAAKWLQQYGSLSAILEAQGEITGKVGESLREYRELAVRNRRLNHLVRDLPFDFEFESLRLRGVDAENVKTVFGKLHFKSLTERVLRLRGSDGAAAVNSASKESSATESADITEDASVFDELEMPTVETLDSTAVAEWLAAQTTSVAIGFKWAEGALIGVGLATETARIEWAPKSNQDVADTIGTWLAANNDKATFDEKNNSRKLLDAGIALAGVSFDALLMAFLLNPVRKGYALDDLALEYLGIQPERKVSETLLDSDSQDASLDAWLVASLAPRLFEKLRLSESLQALNEIELPTSKTLARMEHYGIAINRYQLDDMFITLGREVDKIAAECYAIIGKEINLASPKQLQTVLFEDLGMTGTKTVKTGFSTNAAALNELFEQTEHPFLAKLLEHREVSKLRQIIEIIIKAIAKDGRIHTNYVQTGTSTGRLASDSPNLQNIPIKSERGKQIRDAFMVGEGFDTLLSADYSQIEMRIMAHLSEDEGLIEAFNTGEDLHRFVGSRIFGVAPSEVTSAMRGKVKAMSYGLVYGLSEYGLAKQLRISNGEAKQLMADYFARFGGVRRYLAKVVDEAKLDGYTVTSFGRRRPFDDLRSSVFQVREAARRAALNAPIQGTAADIMKLAMTRIDKKIALSGMKSRMLLQVHDELVFEVAAGELDALKTMVVFEMQNVVKLSVPLDVHVGIGKTWAQADH